MKVCLKRTGGLAGMTKQWKIDFSILPSQKTSEFKKLLEAANFFAIGTNLVRPEQGRDQFCYEITVEEENKKHTVQCVEETVPKPLNDCLKWIHAHCSC